MLPFLLESDFARFFLAGIALIAGVALHEFAHAAAALLLGDPTGKQAGRLTLDPRSHLDVFGSFMILLAGLGWGKRVPVAANRLGNPKRDQILIALSGPGANLVLAVVAAALAGLLGIGPGLLSTFLLLVVFFNLILAIFNLLPVPPLDGFALLELGLPPSRREVIYFLEKWGFLLLLALAFFFFQPLATPAINALARLLLALFGAGTSV